jgi:hypothetical protein
MQRILESQTFATSPRLREVLVYLLKMMEKETSDEITEQSIGQAVFGRSPGYNASDDNIVRVTVRHLRNRLEEYYASEGATDPLALVIPKGKYIPSFVLRQVGSSSDSSSIDRPTALPEQAPLTEEDTKQSAIINDIHRQRTHPLRWLILSATVLIAFLAGYALRTVMRPSNQQTGVMGELFAPGDNVTLVTVDANLQAYRQIFKRQVSLGDYIRRTYVTENVSSSDPRIADAHRFATGTNETSVSDVIIAAAVRQALEGRRLIIKHPHDVSVRDFQDQGNVILMGGPWSDPWGSSLRIVSTSGWCRNLKSLPVLRYITFILLPVKMRNIDRTWMAT